jgi:hypothetical protein
MAADNFLQLTNRVLKPINEVQLTSATFAAAEGIFADAKDAINQGLFDVYTYKNIMWPFLWSELTFDTIRGIIAYSKPTTVTKVDWFSFTVERGQGTATSLTSAGLVATFTATAAHNLATGDRVEIIGATPDGYNTYGVEVTVTGSTTFTFPLSETLASPATGTILFKSNTVTKAPLAYIDKDEYIKSYASVVENTTAANYTTPKYVSRKPDNSFLIFDVADRVYDIKYSGYSIPSKLSAYTDTHLIPEEYEQAAVDMGLHYIYMFRDNLEQATLAKQRADQRLAAMVRVLSPFANNMVTP